MSMSHVSAIRRIGWLCLLLFAALSASAQEAGEGGHERFLALELLEPRAIRENRVRTMTVSLTSGSTQDADVSQTCLVESFEFDERGNLVLHSPPLIGSDYYFTYDANNEVADFGRIDANGDAQSLAGYLEEAIGLIYAYERERVVDAGAMVRSVSSACFNVDAEYRFLPVFDENGLPTAAPAQKTRELDSGIFPTGSSLQSSEELRVEFSYHAWNSP